MTTLATRIEAAGPEDQRALLAEALDAIHIYGLDTLTGPAEEVVRGPWYRDGVREMAKRARAALADYWGK